MSFWGIPLFVIFIIPMMWIPLMRQSVRTELELVRPYVGGLRILLTEQRDFRLTVDDVLRISIGVFMVWLAYMLLENSNTEAARYIMSRGLSLSWVIMVLSGCGMALIVRRWNARMFFLLIFPMLIFSATTGRSTMPFGFQAMLWITMAVQSLRLSHLEHMI